MRVLCVDDKALPEGAEVEAGREYEVLDAFVNAYGQRAYLIKGIRNEGDTRNGVRWHGYSATRFAVLDKNPLKVEELENIAILN